VSTLQQMLGRGVWLGADPLMGSLPNNGVFSTSTLNATGQKMAFVGRVWWAGRSGTKAIRRVGFRFGTVTKASGSGLTVSLQDIATASGPPGQPDETQDQTVSITNADAGFASNLWYRTGTLSADRTVSLSDPLAVVVEFDGSGRLGADSINIAFLPWAATALPGLGQPVLKSGGTWALVSSVIGNLILEFSDGTFGTLDGCIPVSAFNTHTYNSGSAADEFAMPIYLPFACKIDALRASVSPAGGTSDFSLVLYQGTTALVTASVDANQYAQAALRSVEIPIAETTLSANTQYYLSVRPDTANNISVYSFDVNAAGHLATYPGGTEFSYTTRVDAGSWASKTTTRALLAGIRISSLHDGTGGGGGSWGVFS